MRSLNVRALKTATLGLALLFLAPPLSQAQELKSVFQNSLWGGALGGLIGSAAWALQDEDKEDKLFSKYVIRGAAIGVMGGALYGLVMGNSSDPFAGPEPGVLHLEGLAGEWSWHPQALIPQTALSSGQPVHQINLITGSF
jgi:hypothetical protein